jgi:hypothetical protein
MKELWIAAHEALVAEYLEANPHASETAAYNATEDAAFDRVTDQLAAAIDDYKDRMKYGEV